MPASGDGLRAQVRSAVIWRSGTQVLSQLVAWISTFLVIRILSPADYGLFAMTSVVLVLLTLFNGMGFANAAIQQREGGERQLRQLFGLLLLFNGALAAIQVAIAPLVAAYYHQPVVADLLRVQALIYLTNPFFALGYTVLTRAMDFRRQGQVNIVSALVGALTALGGALAGWGVWTLVAAPIASFTTRALGMLLASRTWVWPSFDLRGAGALANYGGIMMAGQLFWFVQTQSDILIAGRAFSPTELGFYTTALFLAHIFVTKVVPPLNEVAFSAYSQVQHDRAVVAAGFLKSVRVIMTLAMPFCLGLAAVAEPAVHVLLGAKWLPAAPIVQLLALAMPFMTLHVLFGPATNACGHPGIATRAAMLGAVLMPLCYYFGANYGARGIAASWLVAWPLLTAICAVWSLRVLEIRIGQLSEALLPPVLAGAAMGLSVTLVDRVLPAMPEALRLAVLVATGAAVFGGWLLTFARERLGEIADLALKR
jgi:O-antigen/teichoic acid export membrane protein